MNEEKPAGVYDVTFNASKLSSGIYFYKLQAGSFISTKKMILIKYQKTFLERSRSTSLRFFIYAR
ncbi:MAG: hypothetical protein AUJ54_05320 [Ignavibacteria bacterium CG1_02_37_35]|nr:MAG: hypothetical protein AUJ54_05320 [Ignavibacteria bacterium CG1_02_37_35]